MEKLKSSRILTIDQGNSSAKAVVWEGESPVSFLRTSSLAIEDILPLIEKGNLDGCAYCSVCHSDAKFLETLRRLLDGKLLVLTPSVELPMKINYDSRLTLGSDRIAAAVGAADIFPGESLLVVDAGTAVTIDVVNANGDFMGGNIAPGMRLRFKCLRSATQQLPLVEPSIVFPAFGRDTRSAIRSGVIGGMVSEIYDAFMRAKEAYRCRRVVITGNDGEIFKTCLLKRGISVTANPNLVGRGLAKIFRYNFFPIVK